MVIVAIRRILALLILSAIWLTSVAAGPLGAQTAAIVGLFPASASLALGHTVDVELCVDHVQALYGLDVRVRFDPRILEAVDLDPAQEGVQVTPGQFPYPDFTIKNHVDNAVGTVWYAVTQLNPRPPANGSGVILTMRFRAKAAGDAAVAIAQVALATREGALLPVTTSDGGRISVSSAGVAAPGPKAASSLPKPDTTGLSGALLPTDAPELLDEDPEADVSKEPVIEGVKLLPGDSPNVAIVAPATPPLNVPHANAPSTTQLSLRDAHVASRPSEPASPATSVVATHDARLAVVAPTNGQAPQPTPAIRHTTRSFIPQGTLILIVISLILLVLLVYLIRRTKTAAPQ